VATFGNLFGLSLYGGSAEGNLNSKALRASNGQFKTTPKVVPSGGRVDLNERLHPPEPDELVSSDQAPSLPPWPDIDPFEEAAARAARAAPIEKSQLFLSEGQHLCGPRPLPDVAGLCRLICGSKPSQRLHL